MTRAEIVYLAAGVMLGGVYADIDGPWWGVWTPAALVGFVIGAAVTYSRRRFGTDAEDER